MGGSRGREDFAQARATVGGRCVGPGNTAAPASTSTVATLSLTSTVETPGESDVEGEPLRHSEDAVHVVARVAVLSCNCSTLGHVSALSFLDSSKYDACAYRCGVLRASLYQ